jgi:hypothetical protein
MVTKLKDNLEYIKYIRKKIKGKFIGLEECGETAFEDQIHNNFSISFKKEIYRIQFVKDRGLLELRIFRDNSLVDKGRDFYDSILENVPDQDKKWRLSICIELIDYYVVFLTQFLKKENT